MPPTKGGFFRGDPIGKDEEHDGSREQRLRCDALARFRRAETAKFHTAIADYIHAIGVMEVGFQFFLTKFKLFQKYYKCKNR